MKHLLALFCVVLCLFADGAANSNYNKYDDLRHSAVDIAFANNLYRVTGANGETFRLAELKAFLPLTHGGTGEIRPAAADDFFAALLSAHRFNSRSDCNVKLTVEVIDTQFSPITATQNFTKVLQAENMDLQHPPATAVLGAYRSAVTAPLAILSGVHGIPQVSAASTSLDLDAKEQYPLFGRTVANSVGEAAVALQYFDSLASSHVAIFFVADAYGSALQKVFSESAAERNITTVSFAISIDATEAQTRDVLEQLADSNIRHIYAIVYEHQLDSIAAGAEEFGLLGQDYFWLYPGLDLDAVQMRQHPALVGAAILTMQGGLSASGGESSGYAQFQSDWTVALDTGFGNYVQSKLPVAAAFSTKPGSFRPFMYDAVTALGVSMCQAGRTNSSYFFSGLDIYEQFRNLDLQGASGRVLIDPETGTRDYKTMSFVVWNVRAEDSGGLAFVPALVYENGDWVPIADNKFIYKNGSEIAPNALPPIHLDYHYIGNTARAIAYFLMSITLFSAILSLLWLTWNRNERIVVIAQPVSLFVLSTGVVLMALTIAPATLDETKISSSTGLDAACMSSPWLYVMGISLVNGALLAKIWALHQAYMQPDLKFVKVTQRGVFRPTLILVTLNAVVLLAWTLSNPLKWVRVETSSQDMFNRSTETYAQCKSVNATAFTIVIGVLNVIAVLVATLGSLQARNIETEFSESRYVGIAAVAIVQAWCVGVPILIVVNDDPKGRFLVTTAIVFVTAQATLLLVYLPKVLALRALKRKQEHKPSSSGKGNAANESTTSLAYEPSPQSSSKPKISSLAASGQLSMDDQYFSR